MTRILSIWTLVLTLLQYSSSQPNLVERQIIVKFKPGIVAYQKGFRIASVAEAAISDHLKSTLQNYQCGIISKALPDLNPDDSVRVLSDGRIFRLPDFRNLYTLTVSNSVQRGLLLEYLSRQSFVEYAEPNGVGHAQEIIPNDQHFQKQWYLRNVGQFGGSPGADVKATLAWDFSTGTNTVTIGILDGGVQADHPDLGGKVSGDYNGGGDKSHGTHVAGIAAAFGNNSNTGIAGVSWGARINAQPAVGNNIDVEQIAASVLNAVSGGARILNNSYWIAHFSSTLHDAFSSAYAANVLPVIAATEDNGGSDVLPRFDSWMLNVTASSDQDVPASYTFENAYMDITAPGGQATSNPATKVFSTVNNSGYDYKTGTSMAAPIVSGVAALLLSQNPFLNNYDLEWIIKRTADDLGSPGWDKRTGWGRINAYNALRQVSLPWKITRTNATLTRTDQNVSWVFDHSPCASWNPSLGPGIYTVDRWRATATVNFPVAYETIPYVWLSATGYEPSNPNPGDMREYVLENTTTTSTTITTYFYLLKAIDGNAITPRWVPADPFLVNPMVCTILGRKAIATPTALNLSLLGSSSVRLSWQDNSDNETVFRIERSVDGINFSEVGTVVTNGNGTGTRTFDDSGLQPGTTYYYRVRGVAQEFSSGYSSTASVFTQYHLGSTSSAATATTNQRKLLHVFGTSSRPDAYHLAYQSSGDVWYTRSFNNGTTTWSGEVLVSRGTGTALSPSIAEPKSWGDDTTYVVWLDTEVSGGQTKYSVFFRKISLVTGQLTAIEKVEFGGAQYWARPNATPVAVRLGAMPNYPDVTVAFEAEGAGIIAAHRYYYGSNGIIWWATQLQGTTTSSAHPSMAISFDYTPYNVSIAYDDGGLIYFATSDVAHQTPVIFGAPKNISSFSNNQYASLAVSPANEKYVTWISQNWWYTGSGFAVVRKWDSFNGWSVTSAFVDDLGNPEYLTSSICAHDFWQGATMFWADRSVLVNMVSPDGFKWTTSSYSSYSSSFDFPNLVSLAEPYTIASVLTKNNQSPFEVKFEVRNNGSYFGHPLAKGYGLDSLEDITRAYRLIELRDSASEEKVAALFGEIKLLSRGGEVLRKVPFTKPTSDDDVLRSVAFNLASSGAIELEFGLAERNWPRNVAVAVDLIDSASGRVIERIHSRQGRGIGHPGFRGRIKKNISGHPTAEPVYLVLRLSGDGLDRYEQFMTNLVEVGSQGRGMFKQNGDAVVQSAKPTVYTVHNNYPNPFNPSTQIKFDLPEPSYVSLIVYDVLGRKVAELVNGTKEAGYHAETWNASEVASGVYFARFTAMDGSGDVKYSKINKLVLMK